MQYNTTLFVLMNYVVYLGRAMQIDVIRRFFDWACGWFFQVGIRETFYCNYVLELLRKLAAPALPQTIAYTDASKMHYTLIFSNKSYQ